MSPISDVFAPVLKSVASLVGKSSLPKVNGRITIEGIDQSVEVIRDQWGIPHIYGKTLNDTLFAQGFVHAQDRLWQMELNRRTARGRLSELFGPMALDTDRAARTFGWDRLGRGDYKNLDETTRSAIDAYTAGINAFLTQPGRKNPVEFMLLGITPEPWQIEDSMAFSRLMFWQLSHAWYSEIVRAKLVAEVGAEKAAEWEPHYPAQNPIILPKGVEFNRLNPIGGLAGVDNPFMRRGQGSNCWVISGKKSSTGKPYLCNDMHLVLTLPTIWYEAHLIGGSMNVTGVTMPGIPFVLVGHNEKISWGITLAFTDCEDLFIEKFEDGTNRYQTPEGWEEARIVEEIIKIKKSPDYIEKILHTRHGPVISDVVGFSDQKVAVQSMALQPTKGLKAWHLLNHAGNWDQFVDAMELVNATQLNIGYADVDGNIGYWVTGAHPIRGKGDGRFPVPGWDSAYDWKGVVPFNEMPHALNPESGYVLTCNHKIIPNDYPHHLGDVWMNGYRARRLSELLGSSDKLNPNDFSRMQMDVKCLSALDFIKALDGFSPEDATLQSLLGRLRQWDGSLSVESFEGAVYEVFRYSTIRNLLEPVLGKDFTNHVLGIAFNPILLTDHEYFGYDTVSLIRMLDNEKSWWIEKAGGKEALLTKSLVETIDYLNNRLGLDMDQWKWGSLHQITFGHAIGSQKPLDKVFNRGPYPIGGDTDTPLQSAISPDNPYDNKLWSPSVRFIMDMNDLSKSVCVTPVGQSGQVGSKHYDDFIPDYLNGRYHPMLFTRKQVEDNQSAKLVLEPEVK